MTAIGTQAVTYNFICDTCNTLGVKEPLSANNTINVIIMYIICLINTFLNFPFVIRQNEYEIRVRVSQYFRDYRRPRYQRGLKLNKVH